MQLRQKQKRKTIINITSLIDVLFLLLIFLLVSTTFIDEPGMKLTLPSAESAEVGEKRIHTLPEQRGRAFSEQHPGGDG